jgi:ribosomal protein S18 acetylase RimI-like enzyme
MTPVPQANPIWPEPPPAATVRPATLADLDALVKLEQQCFANDRLTRRQWRYMLTKAHADVLVAELDNAPLGSVLLLYSRATSVAHLYSIAVDAAARRLGVAQRLVTAAERLARERGRAYMRLEIRVDNTASIGLFERLGYRRFGYVGGYYEDHTDAVRFEKLLNKDLSPDLARVPYYEQTLEFTCGASAVMMAMAALEPTLEMGRPLELRIWREATTIFMTSGHGGCGPFGLALAVARRGFDAEIYVTDPDVPLLDSVRSPEKKEVMRLVHEEMLEEVTELGLPVRYASLGLEALRGKYERGAIPIVLISSYRIYREKTPHWVVVTGFDENLVYVNDPFVDRDEGETETDSINVPIPQSEFSRMARYGRAGLQAVVLVSRRAGEAVGAAQAGREG